MPLLGILSQNGQMTLRIKINDLYFHMPAGSIPGCIFGASLVIPAQICDELSCEQGKVYRQMDWHHTYNNNTPPAWKDKG